MAKKAGTIAEWYVTTSDNYEIFSNFEDAMDAALQAIADGDEWTDISSRIIRLTRTNSPVSAS
jgi:hypothetical protein